MNAAQLKAELVKCVSESPSSRNLINRLRTVRLQRLSRALPSVAGGGFPPRERSRNSLLASRPRFAPRAAPTQLQQWRRRRRRKRRRTCSAPGCWRRRRLRAAGAGGPQLRGSRPPCGRAHSTSARWPPRLRPWQTRRGDAALLLPQARPAARNTTLVGGVHGSSLPATISFSFTGGGRRIVRG